jgi:hypothetical protein
MDIPTPNSPILKDWLLAIALFLLMLLMIQARTDAPGAQKAPINSQNGKSVTLDPGGRFPDRYFFEHNVCFPDLDEAKLILKSRLNDDHHPWYGELPKNILLGESISKSFNIIYIIRLPTTKEYLVELSTFYTQFVDNYNVLELGIRPGSGESLGMGMLDETLLHLQCVHSASENDQKRLSYSYLV